MGKHMRNHGPLDKPTMQGTIDAAGCNCSQVQTLDKTERTSTHPKLTPNQLVVADVHPAYHWAHRIPKALWESWTSPWGHGLVGQSTKPSNNSRQRRISAVISCQAHVSIANAWKGLLKQLPQIATALCRSLVSLLRTCVVGGWRASSFPDNETRDSFWCNLLIPWLHVYCYLFSQPYCTRAPLWCWRLGRFPFQGKDAQSFASKVRRSSGSGCGARSVLGVGMYWWTFLFFKYRLWMLAAFYGSSHG